MYPIPTDIDLLRELEEVQAHATTLKDAYENQKETIAQLRAQLREKEAREHLLQTESNELRNRLQQYMLAADGANDGLWDWNLETGQTFVSHPWKRMLGFNEEHPIEGVGHWEGLLHPEDKERAVMALSAYINGEAEEYDQGVPPAAILTAPTAGYAPPPAFPMMPTASPYAFRAHMPT